MKIHDCVQGSTEWLAVRAGIPTASSFDSIITPGGKPSKSAERYLYTLLAERLMGHPITEHVSMWMRRGSRLEADAVAFYELQTDSDTVPIGFVTNDDGTVGASPDRLVDDGGLLEVKCPAEWIQMGYLMQSGSAYEHYRIQCAGQLWITGRKFVDVLAWHPELPPALHRIERDEPLIAQLSAAVTAFSQVLEHEFIKLVERGWLNEKLKPRKSEWPSMSELLSATKDSLREMKA